jgi:hypothetical protein
MEKIIWDILRRHEEHEWLDRCRASFPGVSDGEWLSVIQLFLSADVEDRLVED